MSAGATRDQPLTRRVRAGSGTAFAENRPILDASDIEELTPAPDSFAIFRALSGLPHVIYFDSALSYAGLSRYSFVTADPFLVLRSRRDQVHLSGFEDSLQTADPLHVLSGLLARFRLEPHPDLPPFQGGAAGMFAYDLCHHIERLPRPRFDEFEVPDLHIGFYDFVVAIDHEKDRAFLISTGLPELESRPRRCRAKERASWIRRVLENKGVRTLFGKGTDRPRLPPRGSHPKRVLTPLFSVQGYPGLFSNFDRETYLDAVGRIIEYIRAGDCFQVNLAHRILYPAGPSPLDLYERLRRRNAAPFAGYYDLGEFVIASASPERFLRVQAGQVETRPIKGTRPRGRTPEEDQLLIRELEASSKDRAENIMIVDLLRNDLGRVCRYGSVRVPAVCRIESYAYVHHLVSQVCGRLRDGLGPVDLLRAAFPGGSVTGAPKIRAMEIIAELEPTSRGPYCGSLGYIGFDGNMDTNILIRTITIGKGWMQFPIGGGIVADSDPEREYEETWHKAEGLLKGIFEER
jgi:para-aminobenzoate synthetase component I